MAKFFKYPFATSGTKTTVPDTIDPSGYVSFQEGYPIDYQRPFGTDPLAKPIERTKLNDVLFEITNAIQQYQTHGVPDFITTSDNGGTAYSYGIYAIVRYDSGSGFNNYMSLKDANTSLPTVTADWRIDPFNTDIASLIHAATSKTTPVDADELGICDSATSFSLKKLTWANLKATLVASFGVMINTLTAKTTPVDADVFIIGDSASSFASKKSTLANLKTVLLAYFDTFYSRTTAIFGIGQTCVDVTGSRLTGTSYVNSSGKTRFVMIESTSTGGGAQLTPASSNGVTLPSSGGASVSKASVYFPVENGASYVVTANLGTVTKWVEF